MQFLIDNYVIIIGIGIFLIFTLIGYLGTVIKNSKNAKIEEEIVVQNIDDSEDFKLYKEDVLNKELPLQETDSKDTIYNGDELLKNYDQNFTK